MNGSSHQKKENLPTVRRDHLTLVVPNRTPEQLLDLDFVEAVVALDTPPGIERPRRLYKIAAGELVPLRVIARVLRDALAADIDPVAALGAIWRPLKQFVLRIAKRRPPRLPGAPNYKRLSA